jgi:acyl carrier protein
MTREEVQTKVVKVLVDALGVDEDEVKPTSVVRDDLGAESIDFLDIMFRLEKEFGIKIPKGEMMVEGLATDPSLVSNGTLTAQGLKLIEEKMPHAAAELVALKQDPKLDHVSKLFTVNSITNYVITKLG